MKALFYYRTYVIVPYKLRLYVPIYATILLTRIFIINHSNNNKRIELPVQ
jgi:hypothetical protein